MAGDFLDLQALDGHGNVVLGDVVRGELVGVDVKNVRRQPRGQKSREVGSVVGVGARFAASHLHSTGSVRARLVVAEVEVQKNFAARGRPSGVASVGEGPTANILNGPVQLTESFPLRILASVPALAPCRMVVAVL